MMSRKVDRRLARHNAALAGKAAPDLELEAAHQFQRTTNRIAAAIAREIGVPEKTVQDWGNVNSGDRGPHASLLYITELALEMRPLPRDRAECFAALDFVEAHLGRVAFELPANDDATPGARARGLAHAVVEFAEFIDCVDDPADLPPAKRTVAHQQLAELIAACTGLLPGEVEA